MFKKILRIYSFSDFAPYWSSCQVFRVVIAILINLGKSTTSVIASVTIAELVKMIQEGNTSMRKFNLELTREHMAIAYGCFLGASYILPDIIKLLNSGIGETAVKGYAEAVIEKANQFPVLSSAALKGEHKIDVLATKLQRSVQDYFTKTVGGVYAGTLELVVSFAVIWLYVGFGTAALWSLVGLGYLAAALLFPIYSIYPEKLKIEKKTNELKSLLAEIIQNKQLVDLYARQEFEVNRVTDLTSKFALMIQYALVKKNSYNLFVSCIPGLLIAVYLASVLHNGVGPEDINDFVFLSSYIAIYVSNVRKLADSMIEIVFSMEPLDLIKEFLNLQVPAALPAARNDILDIYDDLNVGDPFITFNNVSFRYNVGRNERVILHDLSFTIFKGQTVAFVGESSAGKSTILNLLLRNCDLRTDIADKDSGEILIGASLSERGGVVQGTGISIYDFSVASYREMLGFLSQEHPLFMGSLQFNVLYGDSNIADPGRYVQSDRYRNACSDAEISVLYEKERRSVQRGIAPGIGQVSGGQKQRIGIAQLLMRNSKVLLLDEPTSALDSITEAQVINSIKQKKSDEQTEIFVAHRLSTIRHADSIFVIRNGRIIENGTHDELLDYQGIYFKYWEMNIGKGIFVASPSHSDATSSASDSNYDNSDSDDDAENKKPLLGRKIGEV